jgi:hypothetical protein
MTDPPRKPIIGKPVDGKPANDGYRCELCDPWIEYRDLGKVLHHGQRSLSGEQRTWRGQPISVANDPERKSRPPI